jgi:hypothetical protein
MPIPMPRTFRRITIQMPVKARIIRSSKWPAVRKKWLATHAKCQSCSITTKLEVHHLVPVNVDASKELDETNLITLCEYGSHDCHFHFGHLLNWSAYNPNCLKDSQNYLNEVSTRPQGTQTQIHAT